MSSEPPPPLGLRLLLLDRFRVDARLLVRGARVDAVDTDAATGRRVRVAVLECAGPDDGAGARLEAWRSAYEAGLPVCRPLAAMDDDPGPLVILEPPPDGRPHGDPVALAAQARLLAGALAERGLRAGEVGPLDLATDASGGLVLTVPPPVAPVIDPRAEADRLAATVAAALQPAVSVPVPAAERTAGRLPRPGRRGVVRAATLAAALAALGVLGHAALQPGATREASAAPSPLEPAPLTVSAIEADAIELPPIESHGARRTPPRRANPPARDRGRRRAARPRPRAAAPAPAVPVAPVRRAPRAAADGWSLGSGNPLGVMGGSSG